MTALIDRCVHPVVYQRTINVLNVLPSTTQMHPKRTMLVASYIYIYIYIYILRQIKLLLATAFWKY